MHGRLGVLSVSLCIGIGSTLQQEETVNVKTRFGGHVKRGVATALAQVDTGAAAEEVSKTKCSMEL